MGDIIEVADGYAKNYLIPKGLAEAASAQNIHAAQTKAKAIMHKRSR